MSGENYTEVFAYIEQLRHGGKCFTGRDPLNIPLAVSQIIVSCCNKQIIFKKQTENRYDLYLFRPP